MENRIKELEALIVLLSKRIIVFEKKERMPISGAQSDNEHLQKLKDEAKSILKNLAK